MKDKYNTEHSFLMVKKWSELTSGYGAAVDAKTPYVLPETSQHLN